MVSSVIIILLAVVPGEPVQHTGPGPAAATPKLVSWGDNASEEDPAGVAHRGGPVEPEEDCIKLFPPLVMTVYWSPVTSGSIPTHTADVLTTDDVPWHILHRVLRRNFTFHPSALTFDDSRWYLFLTKTWSSFKSSSWCCCYSEIQKLVQLAAEFSVCYHNRLRVGTWPATVSVRVTEYLCSLQSTHPCIKSRLWMSAYLLFSGVAKCRWIALWPPHPCDFFMQGICLEILQFTALKIILIDEYISYRNSLQ